MYQDYTAGEFPDRSKKPIIFIIMPLVTCCGGKDRAGRSFFAACIDEKTQPGDYAAEPYRAEQLLVLTTCVPRAADCRKSIEYKEGVPYNDVKEGREQKCRLK